jgi:hypothetical protein
MKLFINNAVTVTRDMSPTRVDGSIPQFDLSLLHISNLSKIGQSLTQVPTGVRNARFGRKLKLPSTGAIKPQIRKLMFEDSVEKAEAGARAEAIRGQLREEMRSLVQSGRR